jgi:hypothetical protein
MKTILQRNKRGLLLLGMAVFFVLSGAGKLWADDWRYHDRYYDRDGYHHYHHYGYYHHHRGYWDERNGLRIWINI